MIKRFGLRLQYCKSKGLNAFVRLSVCTRIFTVENYNVQQVVKHKSDIRISDKNDYFS